MIEFKNYLVESLEVDKLKHLEHAEDHVVHGGHEGVEHAASTLDDVKDFLTGKPTETKITQKYDGAPSLVFGNNPENGKFFVATKSAFNVNPKLAYSDKDIEELYGHSPGLVEKLKIALEHLPKVMPKKGGVYQGDLMYSSNDINKQDGKLSFTPNTITYSVDKNSPQGKTVQQSKLGIVIHTKYVGKKGHHKTLGNMVASFDVPQRSFQKHKDVNVISPEVKPGKLSSIEHGQYKEHMNNATETYRKLKDEGFDALKGHVETFKTYINTGIREDKKPSVKGYRDFLVKRLSKEVEKAKSPAGKEKKQKALDDALEHVDKHKQDFQHIFDLHSHVQKAKDVLVSSLARAEQPFETTIGGKPTKPEGFVAIRNGRPTKLVDRAEFSRHNFLSGTFKKSGEQQVETPSTPSKPVVFAFGRMNPPTTGHKVLVDKVHELAKENNAKHEVVLSHSTDPEKNPLTPEQKLTHAKRMFPNTNISVASKEQPSVIEHAKRLSAAGHDHLIMVAGSDRVEEYKSLLDRYNGKEYKFKKIDVVSAGQRDPDAAGVEGMSASKMREHAIGNRFSQFKKGIPSHVHPEHARQLFDDVRRGMDITIDQNTSGISLARYAKRNDPIGARARKEIDRRNAVKEQQRKVSQAKKPIKKIVKEEFTIETKKLFVKTLLKSIKDKTHGSV